MRISRQHVKSVAQAVPTAAPANDAAQLKTLEIVLDSQLAFFHDFKYS